ncbi:hypothetical protein L2E82_19212 [Cichorium intybus]|uniref:Uncharacterized protein n=1 Tax=Cichorium intybus TaxID=13427 RepID=A0ACB9FAZ6_CICIN|nr:hypothetical protein L2E82_19212 [Cichorium intybus]
MGNPEKGATEVLNQWENEGKKVTKWELCRIVKEMRKYGPYKLALEIYNWMNNRPERFRISSSDAAINSKNPFMVLRFESPKPTFVFYF